jgi:hypothetical protein
MMTRYPKMLLSARLLLAVLVATLALAIVAHATQVISTPNAAFAPYNLAAGASSGLITPVASESVLVMGVQTASGERGVGQVAMLHVPASFLEWVGLESTAGAAITQGFSGVAGTHIVWLDFGHQVDIQVASPDSFRVHNGSAGVRTGNVTLIW